MSRASFRVSTRLIADCASLFSSKRSLKKVQPGKLVRSVQRHYQTLLVCLSRVVMHDATGRVFSAPSTSTFEGVRGEPTAS